MFSFALEARTPLSSFMAMLMLVLWCAVSPLASRVILSLSHATCGLNRMLCMLEHIRGYLNCKKQYLEMSNYLPHFAEALRRHKLVADYLFLLNTITDSHNSNFTNIVLPSTNQKLLLQCKCTTR